MKKIQKKRLLIGVIIAIMGGIILFYLNHKVQLEKQAELERNREYEVSLVNALKNSYKGIEEIRITNPNYTMPPGSWSCDVMIIFEDGENVMYRIGHSLHETQNYHGSRQSDEDWEYLEEHKGQTINEVKVLYSNSTEGEQ